MLLKYIKIENYGCLENFEYQYRNEESKQLRPIIFVGKNGSGKSLILANIIDALIETKKRIFPDEILEVKQNNYFKIGNLEYIRDGADYSNIKIQFNLKDKIITYNDIMSNNPQKTINDNSEIRNVIQNDDSFIKTNYYRNVDAKLTKDEFNDGCYLYFPADRFYVPHWFNNANYAKLNYDEARSVINKSSQNIIKNDVSQNIKKWLRDVFLSRGFTNVDISNKKVRFNSFSNLQDNILKILKIIKGDDNIFIPLYDYKSESIQIKKDNALFKDLDIFSSGEVMILCIFLAILKEYDLYHTNFKLEDISGIYLIDEIDLNLHISYQQNVLPKLIKLFPRIQFIITTHSPFFVMGMHKEFEGQCDIISLPEGNIINDLTDFSEINDAISVFNGEYEEVVDKLKKTIEGFKNTSEKIFVITEGKTDAKYIKCAAKRLNLPLHPDVSVQCLGEEKNCGGDKMVSGLINTLSGMKVPPKIIAIFDRDNENILKKWKLENKKFAEIKPGFLYAFAIPLPPHRQNERFISIEHYFNDNDLFITSSDNRRLYQAKEFYKETGFFKKENSNDDEEDKICAGVCNKKEMRDNHILSGSKPEITTDKQGKKIFSLSKNEFCDKVCNNDENFQKVNFDSFKLIIDLINEIAKKIKQINKI